MSAKHVSFLQVGILLGNLFFSWDKVSLFMCIYLCIYILLLLLVFASLVGEKC